MRCIAQWVGSLPGLWWSPDGTGFESGSLWSVRLVDRCDLMKFFVCAQTPKG